MLFLPKHIPGNIADIVRDITNIALIVIDSEPNSDGILHAADFSKKQNLDFSHDDFLI
jgi:hypothetical protein